MENLGYKLLKELYLREYSPGEVETDEYVSGVLKKLRNGEIMRSERMDALFQGILYTLTDDEKQKVKAIEKRYDVKVIHILHTHMEYGDEYAYVIAPADEDDLAFQLQDVLTDGSIGTYAVVTNTFCTELGSIGIKAMNGGFTRTY